MYKHRQTLQKEIEEKEFEEARAFFAKAEKQKGKKGKKATGDGVSSFCSWLNYAYDCRALACANLPTILNEMLEITLLRSKTTF
jgi:hypothetical protein